MKKHFFGKLLLNILLGLGLIFVISPIVLYWFIHGNYERYFRIINGPYPFSNFGSGPFQLFIYAGLFLLGIVLISTTLALKKKIDV